ncbi:putative DEAD-box ATP-dependent RNA helicase 29 [Mastomys coucha]|uniref:putative DEAD-box ATP-dependent RNA helicase 29 n=1 Tax=Mastomys coucha TaxID=35658 RepID=UPI001261D68B|nr:putative DEAD-box ATP-dependent RNA helicase 29 [Mastomys coucha]
MPPATCLRPTPRGRFRCLAPIFPEKSTDVQGSDLVSLHRPRGGVGSAGTSGSRPLACGHPPASSSVPSVARRHPNSPYRHASSGISVRRDRLRHLSRLHLVRIPRAARGGPGARPRELRGAARGGAGRRRPGRGGAASLTAEPGAQQPSRCQRRGTQSSAAAMAGGRRARGGGRGVRSARGRGRARGAPGCRTL